MTSASDVAIFDHFIRDRSLSYLYGPVWKVHMDQTPEAMRRRLFLHLRERKALKVLCGERRVWLVNLWKLLNGPVLDRPLVIAKSGLVKDTNLI